MPENEAVALAKIGDADAQEYIIGKYRNFIRITSRKYFLMGADVEDIIQEGMIGLFKAIRDYDPIKSPVFKAFVEMCVKRQIQTAIKTAARLKHQPLNDYISFSRPLYEDDPEHTILDAIVRNENDDPAELFLGKEKYAAIADTISHELSKLERDVLQQYLLGKSYRQISETINKPSKSVDTALQRVKRKLGKFISDDQTKS